VRGRARTRAGSLVRAVAAVTAVVLVARGALPASAHAADLFPVDDWLGSGIRKAGEVVLGPLKLGAEEIARLVATTVGALADLLVPKSLVRAGVDGVRWLVALPPVGTEVSSSGAVVGMRMPHLVELRGVLTWIGITLLPLGVVVSAGRAFLTPGVDVDSPAEVIQRALVAGLGLVVYDWAWGVLTRLSRLVTDALLGSPWVADGVERMLEALLIGGAAGTAVAAEFVVPLLVLFAGGALLALLLFRVGLEVATALVYVLGGLALGGSVTGFGRRLLSAWLLAAGTVLLLPVVWAVVFVTGAALMLDAGPAGGSGFAGFVAQLYNVAAALGVFVVAIKLARGILRQAGGAIGSVALTPATATAGAGRVSGPAGGGAGGSLAANATPAGLARFSQTVRGGARAGAGALAAPVRHPVASARAAGVAARRPVQATRAGADALRATLTGPGGAALMDVTRARATRRVAGLASAGATDPPGRAGARPATPAHPAVAGGRRRARAEQARRARERTRRLARTDWSRPRPVTGRPARLPVNRGRRPWMGPWPWWADRRHSIRKDNRSEKGDGRGR
jgi:hypothetical protein